MKTIENLEEFRKRLAAAIKHRWRIQAFSKNKPKASCVAYITSRDVQNRLDEVVGCAYWQDDYKEVKGNVYAGIGIYINGSWVWKWDCGAESNHEAEKGEASDSFKRAAVKWNIGRFLYDMDIRYVNASETKTKTNNPYPIDENGSRIWDLTKYFSQKNK